MKSAPNCNKKYLAVLFQDVDELLKNASNAMEFEAVPAEAGDNLEKKQMIQILHCVY
ncbi:7141_t:CDS:2 [Paraglomus brasilianum]|uniref:7141_t:CDS:1 n=1 Tax=Paraglomus brasilianum TaxID=144538 RepID=A0A9N9C516_9GLOM|nr:7141_t:CDS:2 [Paraglomus brasilianum]